LAPLEEAGVARSGRIPDGCQGNGHLFYLLVQDSDMRGRLIAYLRERGIAAVFHYVPLHSSPQGRRVGRVSGELAVTETLSERLVRLPVFHDLTVEDQQRVIDEVLGFFG
jgi:dTDP-4-amino-4,6-dideoxygalactose transaminase